MGTLYMVATPLGNLSDMTFRAVETLKAVDLVACEDTRRTLKLLTHFGIQKPLLSCNSYSETSKSSKIIEVLSNGGSVAFVSDAGTPGISDPGAVVCRLAADQGFPVLPIPGPSAFAALLSVSGAESKTVLFEGFLSPKPGKRRSRLKELAARGESFVIYESPYRIVRLIADIEEVEPECHLVVGREMTKIHEEYLRGKPGEIKVLLEAKTKILGEFSVLVGFKKKS